MIDVASIFSEHLYRSVWFWRSPDQYESRRCERGDGAKEKSGPERNALVSVLVLGHTTESLGAVPMGCAVPDPPHCSLVQWVKWIGVLVCETITGQHCFLLYLGSGMGLSSKSSGFPHHLRTFRTLILRLVWSIGSLQHITTSTICCDLQTEVEAVLFIITGPSNLHSRATVSQSWFPDFPCGKAGSATVPPGCHLRQCRMCISMYVNVVWHQMYVSVP